MKIPFLKEKSTARSSFTLGTTKEMKDRIQQGYSPDTKGLIDLGKAQAINSELGEAHPFEYTIATDLCKKHAFTSGVIERIVNAVWGPGFFTKSDDKRAKDIIDNWNHDVNFKLVGREWLKQALRKGFSPLEIGGDGKGVPQGIKLLNANRVFIKRDEFGNVTAYNQLKPKGKMTAGKDNFIPFKPSQISALHINRYDDEAYGVGIIYPLMASINNIIGAEQDMHKLLKRKANQPMWAKLGTSAEDAPTAESVDDFAAKMQYMNNTTEWATDYSVDIKVLDFGDIGKKFETILNHDADMIFFGSGVPEVIMGRGNIPEGLAKTQDEVFDRFVTSLQMEIEPVVDELYDRILEANGLKSKVTFEWGIPTESQMNAQIMQITALISNPMISPQFHFELEKKLAKLFDISEKSVTPPDMEKKAEVTEPQPKVPGKPQDEFFEGELHRG